MPKSEVVVAPLFDGRYSWEHLLNTLGYTEEYLLQVKKGRSPITQQFIDRACRCLEPDMSPEKARLKLFVGEATHA